MTTTREAEEFLRDGAPYRNRTGVSALRGPRPRPLDEGSVRVGNTLTGTLAQARCRLGLRGVLPAGAKSLISIAAICADGDAAVTNPHLSSPLHHASRGPPPPLRGGGLGRGAALCALSSPLRRGRMHRPRLRLGCEADAAGFLQGLGVEGADFGGAGDVEGDHDAVAGDRSRDHAGRFRQGDDAADDTLAD
jgi:hypothetical protein